MTGGLTDVPRGHVAAVVTYLEMKHRPVPAAAAESPLRLERWAKVDPDRYRMLFRKIGQNWLWFSRLAMDDATLLANVAEVHAVLDSDGAEVGLVELDFRGRRECLIRFLGLVAELAGRGHGRWLFAKTLELACRILHVEEPELGLSVGLEAFVPVEVVGRNVEQHGDVAIEALR